MYLCVYYTYMYSKHVSNSEMKIAFIIAHKECSSSSFVWNSQGALFYSHRSE